MPGPARGTRQRRPLARAENPEELVKLQVRVPDRLRRKLHEAAAAANVSASVYLEQLLEHAMPEPAQEPLPLAETA
jgi:predicted HicB family RNase H-like nuclease